MMDLFTLKSAIKEKTILCIPFTLHIPKNFPVSYNQNLDLSKDGNDVKALELKRIQILKNRRDVNYSGFMKRTIHTINKKIRGNKINRNKKRDKKRYGKNTKLHRIPTKEEKIDNGYY